MSDQKIVKLKCLMLGTSGSGKTTFIKSLVSSEATNDHISTEGVEFYNYTFFSNGKLDIFCHLVDTSASVSFNGSYIQSLLNKTNFVFLFFDCSSKDSLAKMQGLIPFLQANLSGNRLSYPWYPIGFIQ